jgi:hypothetical protein
MSKNSSLHRIILADLYRAEAILSDAENSKKKQHAPTVEYFRGQLDVLRKLIHVAERYPQQNPCEALMWYVDARADGWECEPLFLEGDHWEHALLRKENLVAQVDIVAGHVTLWRDGEEIEPVFPYNNERY